MPSRNPVLVCNNARTCVREVFPESMRIIDGVVYTYVEEECLHGRYKLLAKCAVSMNTLITVHSCRTRISDSDPLLSRAPNHYSQVWWRHTTEVTSLDHITPGVDTFRSLNHVTLSAIRPILRICRSCLLGEPQHPLSPPNSYPPPPRVLIVGSSY